MYPIKTVLPGYLALIAFVLLASGCAYMPDNGFSRVVRHTGEDPGIRRVVLLDVPVASKIWLGDPGSGAVAGLFGPLAALATASHDGSIVTNASAISASIEQSLQAWLEKSGVEVTTYRASRVKRSKLLSSYEQVPAGDADAILEVAPIHIGFRPELGKVHFGDAQLSPDVALAYRLVSAHTGETLVESNVYYSSFDYSRFTSWAGDKLIGPDTQIFEDEAAVKASPDEARRRLEYAIDQATRHIVQVVTS